MAIVRCTLADCWDADATRHLHHPMLVHLEDVARARGCTALKAITTPTNHASLAFHGRLGVSLQGETGPDDVRVVADYAGPGRPRVVFRKPIGGTG